MFLYNITVIVDSGAHEAVRKQIEQQIRPYRGMTVRLLKLLNSPHEGVTYCIHLHAETEAAITQFQQTYLARLQELTNADHPGQVLFFDSTMKYLTEFSS